METHRSRCALFTQEPPAARPFTIQLNSFVVLKALKMQRQQPEITPQSDNSPQSLQSFFCSEEILMCTFFSPKNST